MPRAMMCDMVGKDRYVEVFVSTPLEVCEQRDAKGLYAKARQDDGFHRNRRSLRNHTTSGDTIGYSEFLAGREHELDFEFPPR